MSLKKMLNLPFRKPASQKMSLDDLINAESAIGRTVFGPIPDGHQREFFIAKKNVWLYYENWLDVSGIEQKLKIRYEVRPTGVFKKYNDHYYHKIEGEELANFCQAVRTYSDLVKRNIYT